jgi:hypothetical protein
MILELPATQQQGKEAMQLGRAMAGPGCPEGFTFNPFKPGSSESENFLIGCREAAFMAFH